MRHCQTDYPKKRAPLHACPRLGKLIVSADVGLASIDVRLVPIGDQRHRNKIKVIVALICVQRGWFTMFNPTLIVIEAFIRELRMMYERTYGTMEPGYPGVISFVAQLALENIATSDAAYHDVNHTIMVTLVGQEILRGRHISVGGVTPSDWLHFIISLLCHDIGYVRGIVEVMGMAPMSPTWPATR